MLVLLKKISRRATASHANIQLSHADSSHRERLNRCCPTVAWANHRQSLAHKRTTAVPFTILSSCCRQSPPLTVSRRRTLGSSAVPTGPRLPTHIRRCGHTHPPIASRQTAAPIDLSKPARWSKHGGRVVVLFAFAAFLISPIHARQCAAAAVHRNTGLLHYSEAQQGVRTLQPFKGDTNMMNNRGNGAQVPSKPAVFFRATGRISPLCLRHSEGQHQQAASNISKSNTGNHEGNTSVPGGLLFGARGPSPVRCLLRLR